MSLEKLVVKKGGFKSLESFLNTVNKKNNAFYKDNFFMGKEKYLFKLSSLINEISEDAEIKDELKADKKPFKKKFVEEIDTFKTNYKSKLTTLENHIRFFQK